MNNCVIQYQQYTFVHIHSSENLLFYVSHLWATIEQFSEYKIDVGHTSIAHDVPHNKFSSYG